jgi:SatD family protein
MPGKSPDDRKYVVVIGDIVSSRRLDRSQRSNLQQKLIRLLARLNREHKKAVFVDFTLTAGDEFQGVLNLGPGLLELLDGLHSACRPVHLRLGVGAGTLTTAVRNRPQEMDGEAFVRARSAINRAEREKARTWFVTHEPSFDLAANAVLLLIQSIQRDWKELHFRRAALKAAGADERKIAQKEGVTQQAINKSLGSARYRFVHFAEVSLAELFNRSLLEADGNPRTGHTPEGL